MRGLMNVSRLVLGGLLMVLGCGMPAAACFIGIAGILFGIRHVKLARVSLAPTGKTVVPRP